MLMSTLAPSSHRSTSLALAPRVSLALVIGNLTRALWSRVSVVQTVDDL